MKEKLSPGENNQIGIEPESSKGKKRFADPKLTFVEPKLVKHGDATKITGGFFGTFSP